MTATIRKALALSFAVLLVSCGLQQATEDATKEIDRFHAYFDKEAYDAIWNTTSSGFRQASKKEDFEKLLTAIHAKLGAVKKSDQQGWQANTTNGISTVVVTTKTVFAKGDGAETFTYIREGDGLKLLGYNIQSAALIYN